MRTLAETRLIFLRAMRLSLRNPIWVIIGLVQPLLYLALFGPLLERVVTAQSSRRVTPGRSSCPGYSSSWASSARRSSASD